MRQIFDKITDRLTRDSDIGCLTLENADYTIRFYYYGEYKKDIAEHAISLHKLSMACRTRNNAPKIFLENGVLYVNIIGMPDIQAAKLPEIADMIQRATPVVKCLEGVLKKYFEINTKGDDS